MEPICLNKIREITRRTPIRIEESVDIEFFEENRVTADNQNKLELLRTQLIDAGFICEYEVCEDEADEPLPYDTPVLNEEERQRHSDESYEKDERDLAKFTLDWENYYRRRRGLSEIMDPEYYIVLNDDDDDDDVMIIDVISISDDEDVIIISDE